MPSMNTDSIELNVLFGLRESRKFLKAFLWLREYNKEKKSPSLSSSELMNALEKE